MKKIVIASTLKPVDDVRSYWKLSQSMAKTNKYVVNIIGNSGKKEINDQNIQFHPHKLNRSDWMKRLTIKWQILIKTLRLKPDLFIITTHELIAVALLLKLFTSCGLIYDVQENYYLNLTKLNSSLFKKTYALFIRLKERLSQSFFNICWLAEQCYEEELPFIQNKIIVENKAISYPIQSKKTNHLTLGFTGTISHYSGIQNALNTFDKLKEIKPNIRLKITGQVHDKKIEELLYSKVQNNDHIQLEISKDPISYEKILYTILSMDAGIIGYEENLVNQNKTPTKLFEYSRYRLPYLVSEKTAWSRLGEKLGGAIPVDFNELDPAYLLHLLENNKVRFPEKYPEEMTWENEFLKVITSIDTLFNRN